MTSYLICIKMTSPTLKNLVTKFFRLSMVQTIDVSKETKMIMKFSWESVFFNIWPRTITPTEKAQKKTKRPYKHQGKHSSLKNLS